MNPNIWCFTNREKKTVGNIFRQQKPKNFDDTLLNWTILPQQQQLQQNEYLELNKIHSLRSYKQNLCKS